MHVLEWKCMDFNQISYIFKFVSNGPEKQYSNIGSDNGLAPTRQQVIIWTNDGKCTDAYMHHSVSMS